MKAGNRRRENVRVRGGASSRSFVLRSRRTLLRRILSPVSDLSVESSPFDYPPPGTPQARSVSRQSRVAAGTDRFFSLVFTTVLFSLSLSRCACLSRESFRGRRWLLYRCCCWWYYCCRRCRYYYWILSRYYCAALFFRLPRVSFSLLRTRSALCNVRCTKWWCAPC